eukprot:588741-Alexandrium_andersonii.AAC.1
MPLVPTPPTPPRVPPRPLSSGEGGAGHTARGKGIRVRGPPAWGCRGKPCNLGLEGHELRVDAANEVLRAVDVGAQRVLEPGELGLPRSLEAVQ